MRKTIKDMTTTEYAEFLGVSKPAIIYRIKHNRLLPGVVSFEYNIELKKYIFKFDTAITKEDALKYFQELGKYQKHQEIA